MVNKTFLKLQIKQTWIVILVTSLCLIGLGAFGLINKTLLPYKETWSDGSGSYYLGGAAILKIALYQLGGPLLFLIYGLVMMNLLVFRDLNERYLASWLTTPMSRNTIFNTKLITILLGFVISGVALVVTQIILYGAFLSDFKTGISRILLSDLSLFALGFLILSLMWILAAGLPKVWQFWLVLGIFIAWTLIGTIFGLVSKSLPNDQTFKILGYLRYTSILSLQNDALGYVNNETAFSEFINTSAGGEGASASGPTAVWKPIKVLDFAWQIPTMIVAGSGMLIGARYCWKTRNFNF